MQLALRRECALYSTLQQPTIPTPTALSNWDHKVHRYVPRKWQLLIEEHMAPDYLLLRFENAYYIAAHRYFNLVWTWNATPTSEHPRMPFGNSLLSDPGDHRPCKINAVTLRRVVRHVRADVAKAKVSVYK